MDKRDEQYEDLAALALGSLDESEARELAANIEADAELFREFAEWQDLTANLVFVAPTAEPAATVRKNILAAIRATPQRVSDSKQGAENGAGLSETAKLREQPPIVAPSPQTTATVLNFPKRPNFWRLAPTFGAVAASVIALLLAVSLYNTAQSERRKSAQIAELNQKISDVQAQLERERQERELLASPASFVKALAGTNEIPTAKARLVFDPKTGRALLYVEGLPAAPKGKAYQIWFISDPKHPAPGRTFETDLSGKGVLRDEIPAEDLKAGVFAVTLEPIGGSPAPTGSVVLKTTV